MSIAKAMTISETTVSHAGPFPGPRPRPLIGNSHLFFNHQRPWEVLQSLTDEYGELVQLWLAGKLVVLVHDPDLLPAIFEAPCDELNKSDVRKPLKSCFSESSPFAENGAQWSRKRRVNPLNHKDYAFWQAQYFDTLRQGIRDLAPRVGARKKGQGFVEDCQRLVFDCLAKILLGHALPRRAFNSVRYLATFADLKLQPSLSLPGGRFLWQRAKWLSTFSPFFNGKCSVSSNALSGFLKGIELTNEEQMREAANVFLAGLFSTSSALANTLILLAKNPSDFFRVRDQALQILNSKQDLTYDDVKGCSHLEGSIREALRLCPPTPMMLRSVGESGFNLGGHLLSQGIQLIVSPLPLHTHKGHWRNTHEFRPKRWNEPTLSVNPYGSAFFFPFGMGKRACLGQEFALYFLRTSLFTILSEFAVNLEGLGSLAQEYSFGSMMPKGVSGRLIPLKS